MKGGKAHSNEPGKLPIKPFLSRSHDTTLQKGSSKLSQQTAKHLQ